MAITYPVNAPSTVPATIDGPRLVRAQASVQSIFSLKEQIIDYGGSQWECDFTLPPLTDEQALEWTSFFASLQGRLGWFQIELPVPKIQGHGSTATHGGAIGDTEITVSGLTNGQPFNRGFISIASRPYMIIDGPASVSGGAAAIEISPPIRLANTATVNLSTITATMRLAGEPSVSRPEPKRTSISFAAVEARV